MSDIFSMLQSGDVQPIFFMACITIILSIISNLIVAKLKAYNLLYALVLALPPFLNIYISIGYILAAVFKKSVVNE